MRERDRSPYDAAHTFVLRTPLLPHDELLRLGEGLEAASADPTSLVDALARDRALLRSRLQAIVARPHVREALFIASPSLENSLELWMRDPESKAGQKIERAVSRYVTRMASRPTPFGLFSGLSTGRVGERSELRLGPRSATRRCTRLDNDYLFELAADLASAPELRALVRWRPNNSLYRAGGRLCYAESRSRGGSRSHHVVAIETSEAVESALATCAKGATCDAMADVLLAENPDVDASEARLFVDELIDAQVVVSDLVPPVTGSEPLAALVRGLRRAAPGHAASDVLDGVAHDLAALDERGIGAPPAAYLALARKLSTMGTPVETDRLLQVDMVMPGDHSTLGTAVVDELLRAMQVVCRMTSRIDPLAAFRSAFVQRYDAREVPLVEALDDEAGLGARATGAAVSDPSPLLRGIALHDRGDPTSPPWEKADRHMLRLLERVWARHDHEIVLTDADIERLQRSTPARIPDAFMTIAQLAAPSPDAMARGEFRLLFEAGGGPSGARLLGRFCHVSNEVLEGVRAHLRLEEALRPDAVFAEVACLPEGRVGNIACRPVLRDHEIAYLASSGVPQERCIPIDDLFVSVRNDRVVLRSRRWDREVVPRCSTAHNFSTHGFGIYRFLCMLQGQDGDHAAFRWGGFEAARFLPRVVHGRVVLARAQWLLTEDDLAPIVAAARRAGEEGTVARFVAVQRLRTDRGLPRHVHLIEGESELLVDLDDSLAVDSFVHAVKRRTRQYVREVFAAPDELVVVGTDGRYRHELMISFTRRSTRVAPAERVPAVHAQRCFPPGSSWVYAKLYGGVASADEVLRRVVTPVSRTQIASGAATRWFFVRYADPSPHLRVRFAGDPARLRREVVPALQDACADAMRDDLIWRVQLDTYEPELERYGGAFGVALAEELFWRDSETVLLVLDELHGDEGLNARWRLALVGIDALLRDLGLDLDARVRVAERAIRMLDREFVKGSEFERRVGETFRRERTAFAAMLGSDAAIDRDTPLGRGLLALTGRSDAVRSIAARLHAGERDGLLTCGVGDMAWSLAHMHVNRLLRASHRKHERVLYELLGRIYGSELARARIGSAGSSQATSCEGTTQAARPAVIAASSSSTSSTSK